MTSDDVRIIEEAYGIKVDRLVQTRDSYNITAKDASRYILRPIKGPPARTYYTFIAVEHLKNNGFGNVCSYIKNKHDMPFVRLSGGFYTLTPVIQGCEMSFDNYKHLSEASYMLGRMHIASKGFNLEYAREKMLKGVCSIDGLKMAEFGDGKLIEDKVNLWVRCSIGQTPGLFKKRLNDLIRYKKVALRNRGKFELEYLLVCDNYIALAERVIQDLEASAYDEIVKEACLEGTICHRDYTAHNIITGPMGDFVSNFDFCAIELPVYDVANFLRRKLRKSHWSINDAKFILDHYNSVRPMSKDEMYILKLLLMFPQKFWRNVNRYYNSRKSWCEKSCIEKLKEIEEERNSLEKILSIFD